MGLLEGKVALITGAGRGQGRSHAIRLAEEGADIIAVDLCKDVDSVPYPLSSESDLAETAAAVEKLDRRILTRQADVRDSDDLDAAVAAGMAEFGRIDIASANAGIWSTAPSWELTDEQWSDMIDVNLSGVWRTTKAVIPAMIAAGRGGSIVLTSSTAGIKGFPNLSHYTAAKHGVLGLTKSLSNELGQHRIRVNAVLPTSVDTNLLQNDFMYKLFLPDKENPTKAEFADLFTPLNSLPVPWVDPVDISNAVAWLASDQARYVTGIALPIDAGFIEK